MDDYVELYERHISHYNEHKQFHDHYVQVGDMVMYIYWRNWCWHWDMFELETQLEANGADEDGNLLHMSVTGGVNE